MSQPRSSGLDNNMQEPLLQGYNNQMGPRQGQQMMNAGGNQGQQQPGM